MKPFVFSLERIQGYRKQVLDAEKNTLMVLRKTLSEIDEKILIREKFRQEKQDEMRIKQTRGTTIRELDECKYCIENAQIQLEYLAEERRKAAMEVEAQLQIVIKASQDVSSLEKLEEKQLEEYQILKSRDNEKALQEHVITQLVYSRDSRQPALANRGI